MKNRVLHIGNIANNGYLNAKILNEKGFACDVLCCDYYHIMACPEWEDADFDASLIDDANAPDWDKYQINGFRRPSWYIQGPAYLCLRYLACRNRGAALPSFLLRRRLHRSRKRHGWRLITFLLIGVHGVRRLTSLAKRMLKVSGRYGIFALALCDNVALRLAIVARVAAWRPMPIFVKRGVLLVLLLIAVVEQEVLRGLASVKRFCGHLPGLRGIWRGVVRASRWLRRHVFSLRKKVVRTPDVDAAEAFVHLFSRCFPSRVDSMTGEDVLSVLSRVELWREALSSYDYIIGYGLDGRWPMMAGKHPYLAYEHGTIRSIPFEKTAEGRLCALTYRLADGVVITNADNQLAAKKLELERYAFIPHPVNEWTCSLESATALRQSITDASDTDFIVFHPSRHHWETQRHPSWEKGNDIFIRGFARFVKECNPHAKAVFVEWGKTVGASKSLLAELGIADRVEWIPPQGNRMMVRYVRASDLVADQFYLGAFGSTLPKALFHETPAMLYLDEERHRWCFPEMPPVISTRTSEDVFEGLHRLYTDQAFRDELISKGRQWYDTYHSNEVIAERFMDLFQTVTPVESDDRMPPSAKPDLADKGGADA